MEKIISPLQQEGDLHRWLVAIAVMLAAVLEIIDGTIVSISLPHMMGTFGATSEQITWILTSYIVSSAIIMPLTGYLILRFGSKKLLLSNIIGFLITSMLCGISTSLQEIVFFRILQGIFGASLVPLSQVILKDTFPPEQMTKAMAIWGVGIMAGPVLGPTLGGYITESFNWRWIFYVNLPICLAAFFMCLELVKETPTKEIETDFLGMGLLALSIGSFQVFLDRGNTENWFDAEVIRWLAVTFVISFFIFIRHCLKTKHPIINLRLFLDRNFSAGCFMMTVCSGCIIGIVSIQPLFLENLMGYPPDFAGLVLAPRGFSSAFAMALVPKLMKKFDGRWLVAAGVLISAMGSYALSKLNLEVGPATFIWIGLIQGFGIGLFFVPLSSICFTTLPSDSYGEAAGIFTFCRSLGVSIGISLLSTLLTRQTQVNWNSLHQHIHPFNTALKYHGTNLKDPVTLQRLLDQIATQANAISFLNAYHAVMLAFLCMLPFVLLLSSSKNNTAPPPTH